MGTQEQIGGKNCRQVQGKAALALPRPKCTSRVDGPSVRSGVPAVANRTIVATSA